MTNHTHPFGPCRFLNLSSSSLAYWKIGSGPDLIFVHGWPLDSKTWRNVVPHLSERFTCHLLDLPGAGYSRWNPETSLELSQFPNVLVEAVRALKLNGKRFVLVGQDSGGGVVRMAFDDLQDSVAGLVLGNTETPQNYSVLFKGLFALGKSPFAKPIFRFLCAREKTRQLFSLSGRWKGSSLEQELTEHFIRPLANFPGKLDAALTVLAKANVHDFDTLKQIHRRIKVPVHLVWGSKDRWFPLDAAELMLSEFAGDTELKVIENAALLVHEEQPTIFAGAIADAAEKCGLS